MLKALTLAALATAALAVGIAHLENDENWEFACDQIEAHGYTCDGLDAPTVVISELVSAIPGVRGLYVPGENYIFVLPGITNIDKTIVHEMVHYIMYMNNSNVSRCESEETARFIAGQRWDDDVKRMYGCEDPKALLRV